MQQKAEDVRDFLKALTDKDFLEVGMHQVAYIRQVPGQGQDISYVVHAADGTELSVTDTFDMAVAAVHFNEMQPVTVH